MSITTQLTWKGFDLTQASVLILTEKKLYVAFSVSKKKVKKLTPLMDENSIYEALGRKKVKSTPLVEIEKVRYVEQDTKFIITHKNGRIVAPFRDSDCVGAEENFYAVVEKLPGLALVDVSDAKRLENIELPVAMAIMVAAVAGLGFFLLSDSDSTEPLNLIVQKIGALPLWIFLIAGLCGCAYWIKRRIDNPLKVTVYANSPGKLEHGGSSPESDKA